MQSGKHEVSGLRRLQRDFNRLLVAHFADQDHFGRLPQGGAQCQRKAGSVTVQLPLMDDGTLVAMHEFDGIFNGQDVIRLGLVNPVENRRQGGRLSRARGAGDQHDAVLYVGNVASSDGSFSSSKLGMLLGITRITIAWLPRWTKTFTRKRAVPGKL